MDRASDYWTTEEETRGLLLLLIQKKFNCCWKVMMKNSYKTQRVKKPYLQASLSKTHYSCDLTLWDVSRILVTDCRVTALESVVKR